MNLNQPSSEILQNSLGSEKKPKQSSTDTTQWIPILIFPLDVFSQQRSDVNFNIEKRLNQRSPMKRAVVQSQSLVRLFATLWTAARQASLSLTISQSLPEFMSIASVMLSSHLILGCSLLLLPSIFPSIQDFSDESAVCIR